MSLREEIDHFETQQKKLIIAAIAGIGAIGAGLYFFYLSFQRVSSNASTSETRNLCPPQRATHTSTAIHMTFEEQATNIQWNEGQTAEDWKRVRSAMEHENSLINHRLTWWLSSQGGLLVVTGLIFPHILSDVGAPSQTSEPAFRIMALIFPRILRHVDARPQTSELSFQIMILILMHIGILTSLFFWRAVRAAQKAHWELEEWWRRRDEVDAEKKAIERKHPPICGTEPLFRLRQKRSIQYSDRPLLYSDLPITFTIVWLGIGAAIISPAQRQNIASGDVPLSLWLLLILWFLGFVVAVISLLYRIFWERRKE